MPNNPTKVIKRRAKAPHLPHFDIVIILDPPPPYVWKRDKLRADLGGLCEDLTGGPLFGPDYHAPAPHADQTVVFQLMHPNHHSLYETPLDDVDSQVLLSPGSFSRDGKIISISGQAADGRGVMASIHLNRGPRRELIAGEIDRMYRI